MERGDFDDLPGAGKPIEDLGEHHDPNWWIKKLVERENIAVLPPSVALRKEDAELDDRLDKLIREAEVREIVEDFNERVIAARYGRPGRPAAGHDAARRRRDGRRLDGAADGAAGSGSRRRDRGPRPGAATPTPLVAALTLTRPAPQKLTLAR